MTSAVATTGVTRLIPTQTSKATFCSASRRSGSPCEGGAQRDRLGEPHVGGAERGELGAGVAGEPGHALARLRRPHLLGGHRRHLAQLVVGDRHGDEVDVLDAELVDRLGHVGQQPVAGRAQLAGARAPAFHVPLQVEPLGQQEPEVLADGELVDLVVAEAAADEHHACALGQRPDRPEVQVVPAEHVVAGEVVVGEHVGEQQRIGVAAVAGQEHQRMAAVALPQPSQARVVDLDVPRPGVQRTQRAGEQVDGQRAHRRDEPGQVGRRAPGDLVLRQLQPRGELGHLAAVLRAVLDGLRDEPRDLVVVAEERALGPPSARVAWRATNSANPACTPDAGRP